MEAWQIAALTGLLSFAGQIGGVIVAVKFLAKRLDTIEASLSRAHDRVTDHIGDHARSLFK